MDTLQELLDAMKAGETGAVRARVDNDVVFFYDNPESELLVLHPYELQMQALAALGIEAEPV